MMALSALHNIVASVPPYDKDFAASSFVNPDEDLCWFGDVVITTCAGFKQSTQSPMRTQKKSKVQKMGRAEWKASED